YLYNIPREAVERFRLRVRLVDLIDEGDPGLVREAVWSCYQEEPTRFRDQVLFDPGAMPGEPICASITWRVRNPWYAPRSEEEKAALERMHQLMERIKARNEARRRGE
ncbi:MAG: hypothetical protein ACPL7K_04360, partial [Armatimonadota bacterium]